MSSLAEFDFLDQFPADQVRHLHRGIDAQDILFGLQVSRTTQYCNYDRIRWALEICFDHNQEVGHALAAENAYCRTAYCHALEKSGATVLADGVVGSLFFDTATLTFGSDIDATVLVEERCTDVIETAIDTSLEQAGIESNVLVVNENVLMNGERKVQLRSLFHLSLGSSIVSGNGKPTSLIIELARRVPYSYYRLARDGESGVQETVDGYLSRAQMYHSLYLEGKTAYQQQPELFAEAV